MARINRTPRLRFDKTFGRGIGVQMNIEIVKAITGVNRNIVCDDVDGRVGSLVNSLRPSAIG